MDSVQIHSCGKKLGISGKSQGSEIATVRSSPESDFTGIDFWPFLKIMTSSYNILVLGCPTRSLVRSCAEIEPVPDPGTEIDRKHDISFMSQILVHGIGIVVIPAHVPTQEHLTNRPAVHENCCRSPIPRLRIFGEEQLTVNL
ncbi:hypothetical protein ES703_114350 [subsurface metagenome]